MGSRPLNLNLHLYLKGWFSNKSRGAYMKQHHMLSLLVLFSPFNKGLERQRLIGSAVAGFNHSRTITKPSEKGLDARKDDYDKRICSPGSLVNYPCCFISIERTGRPLIFQMLQRGKYCFIFFNQHRNKNYLQ